MVKIDNYTLAIGAGILILAAIAFYYFYVRPRSDSDTQGSKSSFVATTPQSVAHAKPAPTGAPTMILFYGDHCPHCHTMMPAWEEAKQQHVGKVDFRELESKNPEVSRHPPAKGVPTIRLYPRGADDVNAFMEYNGDRSVASLIQFATTGK